MLAESAVILTEPLTWLLSACELFSIGVVDGLSITVENNCLTIVRCVTGSRRWDLLIEHDLLPIPGRILNRDRVFADARMYIDTYEGTPFQDMCARFGLELLSVSQ